MIYLFGWADVTLGTGCNVKKHQLAAPRVERRQPVLPATIGSAIEHDLDLSDAAD